MITVVFTVLLVQNGASAAAMMYGQLAAFLFKMSELIPLYKSKTGQDIATFVGVAMFAQFLSFGVLNLALMEFTHWLQ